MKKTVDQKVINFYKMTGLDVTEKSVKLMNEFYSNDLLGVEFECSFEKAKEIMGKVKMESWW